MQSQFKRVLLKLSGEALGGPSQGLQRQACLELAQAVAAAHQLGVKLALVVGGGNLFRGAQAQALALPRTPADQMGMLATIMNGIALRECLLQVGVPTRILSGVACEGMVEKYSWREAHEAWGRGELLLFVGGTGSPYFTTDTAAALRACEMGVDILIKATQVDGVYSADPRSSPQAVKYEKVSYSEALQQRLGVMDATAIALCREQQIPILVIKLQKESLIDALCHRKGGSLVMGE